MPLKAYRSLGCAPRSNDPRHFQLATELWQEERVLFDNIALTKDHRYVRWRFSKFSFELMSEMDRYALLIAERLKTARTDLDLDVLLQAYCIIECSARNSGCSLRVFKAGVKNPYRSNSRMSIESLKAVCSVRRISPVTVSSSATCRKAKRRGTPRWPFASSTKRRNGHPGAFISFHPGQGNSLWSRKLAQPNNPCK